MESVNHDKIEQDTQTQYQTFKEAGGSLTKKDYQTTIEMVKLMTKTTSIEKLIRKAKKPIVGQFDNQAEICNKLGITTTPKQKAIYCFLRRHKENNPPPIMRASGLLDPEIMADIILMTGTVDEYSRYLGYFPALAKRRSPENELL